jgi:hypothetical protein
MTLNYGNDGSVNSGLNKFIWDMRITQVSSVPKRPATPIRPFVKPGKYTVKLTVDDISETQEFELFLNPNESYTKEETDAKFTFWMEMYDNVETSTQNVIKALKLKEEVAAKIQAAKTSGVSADKIEDAEKQAEVIYSLVNEYEGTFVSRGRTLAEVINLPATLLFKMTWINGIMEVSEGPATQSMKDVFASVVKETDEANAKYNSSVKKEFETFNNILN